MAFQRNLSTPMLGLVWFGASVSLAEILTGTFFAPLGLSMGIAAIIIGHVIGCALFLLVSLVSAQTGMSAMQAVGRSFGRVGSGAFSAANVLQLVGWTAIMVMSGGAAATLLVPALGMAGWCIIIGALIVLWIAIGIKRMGTVQSAAAVLLFALTFVVSATVFGSGTPIPGMEDGSLSFGAAVELAAAMPLSWLPVAGDYTREAKRPNAGTVLATIAYGLGSCWMFVIGLGCALYAGSDDVAVVLAQAGMGIVGILVVVFSTVTTTFLDAQSAGVSANAIWSKLDPRICGIVAAVVGTVLAIVAPVGDFEDFLYLIGSVFAPMATIVIVDYFVLHRDSSAQLIDWRNAVLWLLGFILYRFSLGWDIPCGNTLPVMVIIAVVAIVADKVFLPSR
ncbi:MAG: putative hydroxymethylpyrimidine transporter CytX [Coriobacteriia bacterium]|nr:putative hydroxymethylpyrimidine transporter CytX [Coriobacteriia bacterium]